MFVFIRSFLIARQIGVKITEIACVVFEVSHGLQRCTLSIDRIAAKGITSHVMLSLEYTFIEVILIKALGLL